MGDPDENLRKPMFQVDFKRNQGDPFILSSQPEAMNLLLMQQQLTIPQWIVIESVTGHVFIDVDVHQPRFTIANLRKAILQIDTPFPNRFDFGPGKDKSCFNGFRHKIIMPGFPILGKQVVRILFRFLFSQVLSPRLVPITLRVITVLPTITVAPVVTPVIPVLVG